MGDKICVRGCSIPGAHWAACSSWERPGSCLGCVPREARQGAFLCERCYTRLLRTLDAAPDLVSLLRSRADPMKAQVYDRERVSASSDGPPAPVSADLIDASDDITATLRAWARLAVDGVPPTVRMRGLEPGADAQEAHMVVSGLVDDIESGLDRIVNSAEHAPIFYDGICFRGPVEEVGLWTVATALAAYPIEERDYWAAQQCPACDLRTIRVHPPRRVGGLARYRCERCEWEKTDRDDEGLWAMQFSHATGRAA